MKNTQRITYITLFFLLLVSSIVYALVSFKRVHVKTFEEFTEWLNDDSNNCIKHRNISGLNISVKYYPPQYIAQKDAIPSGNNKIEVDRTYRTITFLMSIAPNANTPVELRPSSIMSEGVHDRTEYTERVMNTNFAMDEYISLYVDGRKYKPLLCIVENLYELTDSRSFIAVFGSEDTSVDINAGKEYIFEYNDRFFHIGKIQFPFQNTAMQNARGIKTKTS